MDSEFLSRLIQQPFFWLAVGFCILALFLSYHFTHKDEQVRKQEEMEKARHAALMRRMNDEEQILRDVHDGYEPPKRGRKPRKPVTE